MLYSKIHRATVTDANLNYVGSITIDEELLEASRMRVGQKVEILNIINGAAARKVHKGDKVIIVAYATFDESELETYKPTVVLVDDDNGITDVLHEI